MSVLTRRLFIGASAGALVVACSPNSGTATPALPKLSDAPAAPVARIEPVTDTYFGETLTDNYRWMENAKDADWMPFLEGQNKHTRGVIEAIPGRDKLLARIKQVTGDIVATAKVEEEGDYLFFEQRPAGTESYKLFVREKGVDRLLIDPTTMAKDGGHYSLDWWHASPAGKYVVYGVSKDGSEDSLLHILETATGKGLPETIPNTQNANAQWLDDASGFFYNQLTSPPESPQRYLDSQARFHKLGDDPAKDPILLKRGMDAKISYDDIQMPIVGTAHGSAYAYLILADVRPEVRLYVAPVAEAVTGKAKWVEVAKFEDEVTGIEVDGDTLYLLSTKGAPRGHILKTSAKSPSIAKAAEVVPQAETVIDSMALAKDGLYLRIMDGGIWRLKKLGKTGKLDDIALPFDGTIGGVFASKDRDGVKMNYGGWLTPTGIWQVDASGAVSDTGITPKPAIDVSAYETTRGFATAKDGVKIPYSLIHKKGVKLDGSNPAWISAYGSYGAISYTPAFANRSLAFIDAGGVIGYANVRGGGEYGREWHLAGQKLNKPNTWRDLIAVCEELIAKGYTSTPKLAIGGRSAGGITMGMALTERPDLFAAVVSGVGWHNPLRYPAEPNGWGEAPEWGDLREEQGYKAVKLIDSYQSVKDGTAYPAVLLTTGATDPRVAPFHIAKMAARLQAATSSKNPILLRVDFDAGHGIGSTRSQQDNEAADTYAFILWRTGMKDYQPAG
ncbi:MAG: prolyl oligopeptidase family serine peptidase [Hyphomonadaceae bacterium]